MLEYKIYDGYEFLTALQVGFEFEKGSFPQCIQNGVFISNTRGCSPNGVLRLYYNCKNILFLELFYDKKIVLTAF